MAGLTQAQRGGKPGARPALPLPTPGCPGPSGALHSSVTPHAPARTLNGLFFIPCSRCPAPLHGAGQRLLSWPQAQCSACRGGWQGCSRMRAPWAWLGQGWAVFPGALAAAPPPAGDAPAPCQGTLVVLTGGKGHRAAPSCCGGAQHPPRCGRGSCRQGRVKARNESARPPPTGGKSLSRVRAQAPPAPRPPPVPY